MSRDKTTTSGIPLTFSIFSKDCFHREGITEFNAAAAEPSEERISRVSGAAEVAVSRNIRSHT